MPLLAHPVLVVAGGERGREGIFNWEEVKLAFLQEHSVHAMVGIEPVYRCLFGAGSAISHHTLGVSQTTVLNLAR